jgi:membrane-associated phospholipid phosphatase
MPTRARTALIGAAVSSALLLIVWLLAFHTTVGGHADLSILKGFTGLQRPRVNGLAGVIRDLCNPGPFIALGGALIAVALLRRRPRVALAIGVFLLGANVSTELVLKPLLSAPRMLGPHATPIPQGSYPSGHATAAMSLALALLLVVPARRRPLAAAVGAAFAVAVGYSLLTLGSHYPSDVLGGFLVAVIWVQLAVAGLSIAQARRRAAPAGEGQALTAAVPATMRRALGPAAWAVACAAGLALALVLTRPHAALSYATGHTAFVVGAAVIAAAGLALATAVMLSVRR